jgi:hypothetical protein
MSAEPPKPMQLSPDGRYYWGGTGWLPTLSPSGQWLWDGTRWRPVQALPSPQTAAISAPAPHPRPIPASAWICGLLGAGATLVGAGIAVFESNNHSICSSDIGVLGQGLSPDVAQACNTANLVYYGGIAIAVVGALMVLGAILVGALRR